MPIDMRRIGEALDRAEEVAIEMVRQGRFDYAMKTVFGALREAFSPLVESVDKLTVDVGELRASLAELKDRVDGLATNVDKLAGEVSEIGRRVSELTAGVDRLRESTANLERSMVELRERTTDLERSIRELRDRTVELERGARELRWSLENEVELRRRLEGDVGRLIGRVSEYHLGERLAHFCERQGLDYEPLPREYRANAAITGERLVALVQMAEVGEERDVEQLLEGASIYELEEGIRPHALVLLTRSKRPPGGVVRLCEEHGIMLETSPRRVAQRLAELVKGLSSKEI